jgi:signal transduction histidine kinase
LIELADALASEAPAQIALTLRRSGADPVDVSASVAPLRGADLAAGGSVITLRGTGGKLVAELELARRADELEHCVNTLAHDLRSPLVALLGFSRLLRQDYAEVLDDTALHFVDRIEQAGRTMEALIHDLLELSRIGQLGERRGLVDPRGVLHQIAAEQKPRLEEARVLLELPESPPLLYCDRTRLYQVFSNLIGNAIEHMGECSERRVVVEVREDDEVDHICVRDFGVGIASEHHERIFEPFHSLRPRGKGSMGTGMGLAIVRKIAETHGGRAWVESVPGEGAAFHVTLPRT